jgi:putative endonuclease
MPRYVYILTNRTRGTLYIGVTSGVARRAYEHRIGAVDGFAKRYGLTTLVFIERHEDGRRAFQREQTMKHWLRAWKIALIEEHNPDWRDLYEDLNR